MKFHEILRNAQDNKGIVNYFTQNFRQKNIGIDFGSGTDHYQYQGPRFFLSFLITFYNRTFACIGFYPL